MKIKFHLKKTWHRRLREVAFGIKFKRVMDLRRSFQHPDFGVYNTFIHIRFLVWLVTIGIFPKPKYTKEELEDMEAHDYDLVLGIMAEKIKDDK